MFILLRNSSIYSSFVGVFVYLQRESGFWGHLGYQPLFFPLLKLAEIFLDEEGRVELPNCYLVVCRKRRYYI